MAEYLPACTYDGVGVGYDVGIYDKNMLIDSIIFSTVDAIIADGNLAKAESFGITDGVHYLMGLLETLLIADSITKAGAEAIAESLSIADGITTDGELTKIESFSITDGLHNIIVLTEAFSITDDEAFQKYMYMKIRKINITFSAGNYESNIELED